MQTLWLINVKQTGVHVLSPLTSLYFSPAGIEAAAADVGVRLETHGERISCTRDLHRTGRGAAEPHQPRGLQVRAPVHLRAG